MYCKYCGTEITDDSIFCTKCGQKVHGDVTFSHKEKSDDSSSIRVQLVDRENVIWKDTANLQWEKPIAAKLIQAFLLVFGLFFLCYGIVWSCIIKEKVEGFGDNSQYPDFHNFGASAEDPLGIIDISAHLEDNPDYYIYKSEWETLYEEKYYGKDDNSVIRAKAYDAHSKYYHIAEQMAISKFRTCALFVFILPALILIILSVIWIVKITPKSDKKTVLPRDFANKVENYTWDGFTFHKYIRFIKNDKYGILDAANRSITVPATFELIEWREKNKSYDGVHDGVRKTYHLD